MRHFAAQKYIVGKLKLKIENTFCISFLLYAIATVVHAAPLGLPTSTAKIGYALGGANLVISDPDGDTQRKWATQPLALLYTDWLTGDIRYWAELFYYQTGLDATTQHIGQNVTNYGLRLSLQKSFRVAQYWAPWLGAGINLSQANFDTRHRVDEDGYLLESYADRDVNVVALVLNIVSEWPLTPDWTLGVKLEQSLPTDSDISESSASLLVLYRY